MFVDTTSIYWEVDVADELSELGDEEPDSADPTGADRATDDDKPSSTAPAGSASPRTTATTCPRW